MKSEGLIERLVRAACILPADARGRHRLAGPGISTAGTDEAGYRYLVLDVSGLPPLYRQIYEGVLAERLSLAGLDGVARVIRVEDLVVTAAPAGAMGLADPVATAGARLQEADGCWVEAVDAAWRRAAAGLEAAARRCWQDLRAGRASEAGLRSLVSAKISLNAQAVDTLLPSHATAETWLRPHAEGEDVGDITSGMFLPASGYVAYDDFEDECWKLAASLAEHGSLPGPARRCFVCQGLFFRYDALDTDRTAYHFETYPHEVALRYHRLASHPAEIARRREEIRRRGLRRRLHRSWAEEQIGAISGATARARLLALHRLAGSARDFDEEKRRLDQELWRCLVALAGALLISLNGPEGTLEGLCRGIASVGGHVAIDPVFRM